MKHNLCFANVKGYLFAILLLTMYACKDNNSTTTHAISLSRANMSIVRGETYQLEVTYSSKELPMPNYNWTSSDSDIVTVDGNGKIQAINKGTATIKVSTPDNLFATCVVNVTLVNAQGISLVDRSKVINIGQEDLLAYNIYPKNSSNNLVWTSDDNSVVSVDDKEQIRGLKSGRAVITVKTINPDINSGIGNLISMCEVIVQIPISNEEQLIALHSMVEKGEVVCAQLTNDIALTKNWIPLGNYQTPFKGIFDGNNYTISNIKINLNEGAIGFIGYSVSMGVGYNLPPDYGIGWNGPISSQVKNLCVTGEIRCNSTSQDYYNRVGGIIGDAQITIIDNCVNKINISTTSGWFVGGIAGYVNEISNSRNYGTIHSDDAYYVGGICGSSHAIAFSENHGEIRSERRGAGIVGETSGIISNCVNMGRINASAGIVFALTGGVVENCYNSGEIYSNYGVAGIVYYSQNNGKIENCYNAGTLKVGGLSYYATIAAGIAVGLRDNSSLINCYNIGSIETINTNIAVALLVGSFEAPVIIKNCYYIDRVGYSGVPGKEDIISRFERKTEAQMKLQSTYEQWKFGSTKDNPWKMLEYPVLYWQK